MLLFTANTATADVRHGFGAGVQYAGFFGYQASVQSGRKNFRFGLGYIGVSTGFDYFITPRVAVGIQAFGSVFIYGSGVNLNYYFSPMPSAGWMIGVDVGRVHLSPVFGEDYTETASFISAGYRF